MNHRTRRKLTFRGKPSLFLKSTLFITILLFLLSACQSTMSEEPQLTLGPAPVETQPSSAPSPAESTLTVFAASSLTEAFTELGKEFEAQNPGVKVMFTFAGSQILAEELTQNAPADVFASANQAQMEAAVQAGRIDQNAVVPLLGNRLILVYAKYNPGNLRSFKDLAKEGVKLVLAAKEVPVGQYTLEFLEKASQLADYGPSYKDEVLKNVISFEDDVRAVLSKVENGEADAGIVYQSDYNPLVAPDVGVREIPETLNVTALYYIAPTQDSANPEIAKAFIEFLLTNETQDRLRKYGFIPIQ